MTNSAQKNWTIAGAASASVLGVALLTGGALAAANAVGPLTSPQHVGSLVSASEVDHLTAAQVSARVHVAAVKAAVKAAPEANEPAEVPVVAVKSATPSATPTADASTSDPAKHRANGPCDGKGKSATDPASIRGAFGGHHLHADPNTDKHSGGRHH